MKGKKILIGITGGIAAYKIPIFVRLLIKQGAEVKIIMTESATQFVSPLTLSTLSKGEIQISLTENKLWNNHVELGHWADLFIIAPATLNTISKMAHGICDNLLLATYFSSQCPIMIAPAMDEDMWSHPILQQNIQKLMTCKNIILPTNHGELASGLVGYGRMLEPEELIEKVNSFFSQKQKLKGKKAIVSAGPTYENIDPVRFIGNYSSGKMGIAIAKALQKEGAEVTLVIGPTSIKLEDLNIKKIQVVSAQQMFDACVNEFDEMDIAVMSAAVADYTPIEISDKKNKKENEEITISLKKTKDILKHLGSIKKENQILIGFALENDDEKNYALKKLKEKNVDAIVLNSLNDMGAGFLHDTNKITIFDKNQKEEHFELKSKNEVAHDIVEKIIELMPE